MPPECCPAAWVRRPLFPGPPPPQPGSANPDPHRRNHPRGTPPPSRHLPSKNLSKTYNLLSADNQPFANLQNCPFFAKTIHFFAKNVSR